jgi:hypothetical protein
MMLFGVNRLMEDLRSLGYLDVQHIQDPNGMFYALLPDFEIRVGRFVGQPVHLAIPAPPDYGRVVGSAIHLKSEPHLLEKSDSIPGVRNITDSALGLPWRYWSHRFQFYAEQTTKHLLLQINGVFRYV